MSHTSEVSSVVITDIKALEAAIADLQKQGVRCTLRRDEKPRSYSVNQEGMGVAPYVVYLEDSRYDVGLYYDASKKGYVARTDFYMGHVGKVLGSGLNPNKCGCSIEQVQLGKLYKAYAVQATTRAAIKKGMSVRRIEKEDGSVRLILAA